MANTRKPYYGEPPPRYASEHELATTPAPVSDERLAELIDRKDIACDDWPCLSDDVIAALRELQRLRAGGWRPIDSAPRDGTVVLAWRRGVIAEAYRVQRNDCEMWSFGGSSAAEKYFPEHKPSHWMPVPPKPTGAA